MEVPKKKRGRKPKENIIINDNPIFAGDNDNIDSLIIKLNNVNEKEKDINYNITTLDSKGVGYIINDTDTNISEICWNCCHKFHGLIIGLPISYKNKVFYTVGDFCSLECSTRYAYENYKDKIYETINIINLYNNIKLGKDNKIKMAPNKLVLKKFGGTIDIEEYRKNVNKYNIKIPITLPVNMDFSKYEYNNNNNFKLYRKKKKNENNIFNKMNLNSC